MKLTRSFWGVATAMTVALSATPQAKSISDINQNGTQIRVALLPLTSSNIDQGEVDAISEKLLSEVMSAGPYVLVERDRLDEILKEQGLQSTGCTEQSCAVELGKVLDVERIFIGSVNRIEDIYTIIIREVSVKSARIVETYETYCKGCSLSEFYQSKLRGVFQKKSTVQQCVLGILAENPIPVFLDGDFVGKCSQDGRYTNPKSGQSLFYIRIPGIKAGPHVVNCCTPQIRRDIQKKLGYNKSCDSIVMKNLISKGDTKAIVDRLITPNNTDKFKMLLDQCDNGIELIFTPGEHRSVLELDGYLSDVTDMLKKKGKRQY